MLTNIIVLVIFSLLGYIASKTINVNPVAVAREIAAFLIVIFLVIIPMLYFMTEVDYSSAEAVRAWTDNYILSIARFIENQSVGWVTGYIASTIAGAIIGIFK